MFPGNFWVLDPLCWGTTKTHMSDDAQMSSKSKCKFWFSTHFAANVPRYHKAYCLAYETFLKSVVFGFCFTRRTTLLQENHFKEVCLKPSFLTAKRPGGCCQGWKKPSGRDSPLQWQKKAKRARSPGTASHTRPAYMEPEQGEWVRC